MDNNIETLVLELRKILNNDQLSPLNFAQVVLSAVIYLEGNNFSLKGVDKKKLLLKSLDTLINEMIDDEEEMKILKVLIHSTGGPLIDTLISVDKREVEIKLKKCVKFFCR